MVLLWVRGFYAGGFGVAGGSGLSGGFFPREHLREFVSGALVGSAGMWLLSYAIMALGAREEGGLSSVLLFAGTLVSGAVAGYLVANSTGLEYQVAGPPTGIPSYIFASLILTLVGFRGTLSEEVSALGGYLIGSGVGAKLWDYMYPYVDEDEGEPEPAEAQAGA